MTGPFSSNCASDGDCLGAPSSSEKRCDTATPLCEQLRPWQYVHFDRQRIAEPRQHRLTPLFLIRRDTVLCPAQDRRSSRYLCLIAAVTAQP
jgi:hypothetical protein